MKKLLIAATSTLLLSSSLSAYDNYVKYGILYTVPSDLSSTASNGAKDSVEMKSGYALELAVGEKLSSDLTVEAQYTYDKANAKGVNANIKVHSLYVNGIYNININSNSMHPYIGLGIGGAVYTDGTTNDTVLSYQGFIGSSFDVEHNLETFVEYKYKDFVDVMLDDVSYDDTAIHSLGVGIKSKF